MHKYISFLIHFSLFCVFSSLLLKLFLFHFNPFVYFAPSFLSHSWVLLVFHQPQFALEVLQISTFPIQASCHPPEVKYGALFLNKEPRGDPWCKIPRVLAARQHSRFRSGIGVRFSQRSARVRK